MEEDPQSQLSPRHAEAEENLRNIRSKRFFLWPLLWLLLSWPAAMLGSGLALGIMQVLFPFNNAETGIAIGVGVMASAVPLLAGFVMGRNYWRAKKTLAKDAGDPVPNAWKYPLLFALAQWGLTALYGALLALALIAVFFGACMLITGGKSFH
jgi:hypothetical protein